MRALNGDRFDVFEEFREIGGQKMASLVENAKSVDFFVAEGRADVVTVDAGDL